MIENSTKMESSEEKCESSNMGNELNETQKPLQSSVGIISGEGKDEVHIINEMEGDDETEESSNHLEESSDESELAHLNKKHTV